MGRKQSAPLSALPDELPVYLIHWNAPDWIKSSSESLLDSDVPVRLTIVDNGPHLEVGDLVHRQGFSKVIRANSNEGYAAAANIAIRDFLRSSDELCVIGAHDLHVSSDTLRLMSESMTSIPNCGVMSPSIAGSLIGSLIGEESGVELRSSVNGTCMMIRRQCLLEAGGFDEVFRSYCEDEEFCHRIQQHNWVVARHPDALATDVGSKSEKRNQLCFANQLVLRRQTMGWRSIPVGAGSHLKRGLVAMARGDRPEARARLLGLASGLRKVLRRSRVPRFDD